MKNEQPNDFPHDLVQHIKQKYFPEEFDFHKELLGIRNHFEYHMPHVEQIPRETEAIRRFEALAKKTSILQYTLEQTMPLILNECDKIHNDVYKHRIPSAFNLSKSYIERSLEKLKAIFYSLRPKIGDVEYNKMLTVVNNVLLCLEDGEVATTKIIGKEKVYINKSYLTITGLLNVKIQLENLTTDNDGFIASLKKITNILRTACESIIDDIKAGRSILYFRPSRGRNFEMERSNVIIMFASTYQLATGEIPRAGYYFSTKSYIGDFYEFILECKPLFDLLGVPLPPRESAIGKLIVETLSAYSHFTEQV